MNGLEVNITIKRSPTVAGQERETSHKVLGFRYKTALRGFVDAFRSANNNNEG